MSNGMKIRNLNNPGVPVRRVPAKVVATDVVDDEGEAGLEEPQAQAPAVGRSEEEIGRSEAAAVPLRGAEAVAASVPDVRPLVAKQPLQAPAVVAEVGGKKNMAGLQSDMSVPGEYRMITLSSAGQLGMPPILHVRDYNGADVQKLGTMNADNQLEVLLGILKGLIWEDVDVLQLHEEDVKKILLNIHLLFWGPVIKDYYYPFTTDEFAELPEARQKRINNAEEIPLVDIHIGKIGTAPIKPEAREPIELTLDGTTVAFRIPRVGDDLVAERMVTMYFKDTAEAMRRTMLKLRQEQRAKILKQDISPADVVDPVEREAYYEYLREREAAKTALLQAQQILSYNGKPLASIEEQSRVQEKLSAQWWTKLRKIVEDCFKFGVDGLVEMENPWTKEVVLREVRFQPMDLVPADRLEGVVEFTVKLGGE